MSRHHHRARPSLRRRLLIFLLIPMATLLVLNASLSYAVALAYANRVHDRDLSNDALILAHMLRQQVLGHVVMPQPGLSREYDPNARRYVAVRSSRRGLLAGNADLLRAQPTVVTGTTPVLHDARLGGRSLRAASVQIPAYGDPTDELTITVAETLHGRDLLAREILGLVVTMQALLMTCVLLLVWFGVQRGLCMLDPLIARLAAQTHELTPVSDADVPREIVPLTRTIDGLFSRLRDLLALHDRFIADAAHQLRTPLAGLSLQVDRAIADPSPATVGDALARIRQLTARAARTSSQLLALTRAQASTQDVLKPAVLNLTELVPELVVMRVYAARVAKVDLGYAGPRQSLSILGDASSVQDLLDNLIDNALCYAGGGGAVTVSLRAGIDASVVLQVEDDGPGVPPDSLSRLSERFYRVPDSSMQGSGLGLAIVQQVAERHRAEVCYSLVEPHGLCVQVCFPASTRRAQA